MPTASFLVGGFLREETSEMRQKILAFLNPVSIGLLVGKMDYRKLSGRGEETYATGR
jgi:hypothetical protein